MGWEFFQEGKHDLQRHNTSIFCYRISPCAWSQQLQQWLRNPLPNLLSAASATALSCPRARELAGPRSRLKGLTQNKAQMHLKPCSLPGLAPPELSLPAASLPTGPNRGSTTSGTAPDYSSKSYHHPEKNTSHPFLLCCHNSIATSLERDGVQVPEYTFINTRFHSSSLELILRGLDRGLRTVLSIRD